MGESPKPSGAVEFARLPGNVAVLRVAGRCSFHNSACLEKAAEVCESEVENCRFVLDFERCESMDSTFLGTLAGIALRQRQRRCGDLIAVNVSPQLRRSMELLGLMHVLDLHEQHPEVNADREVEIRDSDEIAMSKADQVAHMIEAHRKLIEVDSGNEVRFENVLKYLGNSLDRARAAEEADSSND